MRAESLYIKRVGAVDWLTIDTGTAQNTLSVRCATELGHYFGSLSQDSDCRVVVLQGAQGNFSAGLDVKAWRVEELVDPDTTYRFMKVFSDVTLAMRACPQPIVALVRGNAAGGGMAYACAADIRLAAEDAKFTPGFLRLGLAGSELGLSYLLIRLVGASRAAEILYSGRTVEAAEAVAVGLVSRVVPGECLESCAEELVQAMLASSPLGLRLTKETLELACGPASLEQVVGLENRNQTLTMHHAVEGVRAFVEKREPDFRKH
jgi:enoyl-CoA hydratase/carnithine racemase